MKARVIFPIVLTAAAGQSEFVSAQEKPEATAKTTAYQSSLSQEQLRATSRRTKAEMVALLDEYGRYHVASAELKRLSEAIRNLEEVTEEDMAAVSRILREASRMENLDEAKARLVEASGAQKEVQLALRAIVDQLLVKKQEAEFQKRLDDLTLRQLANLRETKKLEQGGKKPEEVRDEEKRRSDASRKEQEVLKKEVEMAKEALKQLAEKVGAQEKEAFEKALDKAEEKQIQEQAEKAAEEMKKDFAEAARSQERLLESLKEMSNALQEKKNAAEQAKELADQMQQLANRQEQLAKELPKAWNEKRQEIRKEQEKISDRLDLAKEKLAELNPEAAAKAEEAKHQSERTAEKIADRQAMENIDEVAKATDEQRDLAKKLEEVSGMLDKQAEQLAGAAPQSQDGGDSQASRQESSQDAGMQMRQEALSQAVEQVVAAKEQMELAKRQLEKGSDDANARGRLDRAQQMLDRAKADVAESGMAEQAAEELQKAIGKIEETEQGIGVGSKKDQEKSRWNLDRAREHADRALAQMRNAANQMAAEKGREEGEKAMAQQGDEARRSMEDARGPAGMTGEQKQEETEISAVTERGGGEREALQLLQRERAPAEYESMVEQYIRNLAEIAEQE